MGFKVRSQGLASAQRSLRPRCPVQDGCLGVVCSQIYARPSQADLKICGPVGWVVSVEAGFVLTLPGKHMFSTNHKIQWEVWLVGCRENQGESCFKFNICQIFWKKRCLQNQFYIWLKYIYFIFLNVLKQTIREFIYF